MGHVKEPAGVDLVINSRPLTKDEEIAISKYIQAYKTKHSQKQVSTKHEERMATRKKVVVN